MGSELQRKPNKVKADCIIEIRRSFLQISHNALLANAATVRAGIIYVAVQDIFFQVDHWLTPVYPLRQ